MGHFEVGHGWVTGGSRVGHRWVTGGSPVGHRWVTGGSPVGHRWDRVALDILDMSVATPKGNHDVLVIVDYLSLWTEACL